MAAAWPLVVNRLVALLPTLPGWSGVTVFDGPPVTDAAPTDYVTVGFVPGEDFAGSFEPSPTEGDFVDESGSVRSELVCTTGSVDLPAMRSRAFALFDAWRAEVKRDQTLGVLNPSSTSDLTVDVQPINTGDGSVQRLTVTLTYLARLY